MKFTKRIPKGGVGETTLKVFGWVCHLNRNGRAVGYRYIARQINCTPKFVNDALISLEKIGLIVKGAPIGFSEFGTWRPAHRFAIEWFEPWPKHAVKRRKKRRITNGSPTQTHAA